MRLIKGVLRRRIDFIVQFLLKIEIGIWNSFFDLMMKTKNEKKSKLYFILKQKSNVPFDPRIIIQSVYEKHNSKNYFYEK